ncbi:MAG: hypothetical protein ACI9B9_000606 [Halioglobus sp.]|jgi:hypothetical protein
MEKIIVSWRDIPAQVIIKHRRERATVQLSERFQETIDKAAMRAGKAGSDAYLEDWRRLASPYTGVGSLQKVAQLVADYIESDFSDAVLSKMVADVGYRVR